MKTDELIGLLANQAAPVDPHVVSKRFAVAVLAGVSIALLWVVLILGVRTDLFQVARTLMFWVKLALPLCLLIGAGAMVVRLARPGMSSGGGRVWVAVGLAAAWLGAAVVMLQAVPGERLALLLGQTWKTCVLNIALLSIPGLTAMFWALRGLAPTRSRLAGASGGLLAGAAATLIYCLHCPEMSVPFWALWYVLGMLTPALAGALLGPRWLRW